LRQVISILPSGSWVRHAATGRLLIALAGFVVGLVACALMAIVEYGAWALVVPPRPRLAREPLSDGAPASWRASP
jgi:hypothetical protein